MPNKNHFIRWNMKCILTFGQQIRYNSYIKSKLLNRSSVYKSINNTNLLFCGRAQQQSRRSSYKLVYILPVSKKK